MKTSVLALPRFERAYHRASPTLQVMAEMEFREFRGNYQADPVQALRRRDRVKTEKSGIVAVELDLGGAPRLIVLCDGPRLILADVGPHEVVGRFADALRGGGLDVGRTIPVPKTFHASARSKVFQPGRAENLSVIRNQLTREWLYQLDDEQMAAVDRVREQTTKVVGTGYGSYASTLIVGGPGTGKTAVLLNLLRSMVDEDKLDVCISMPAQVRNYVESATGLDLSARTVAPGQSFSCDVLLVDDPSSLWEINIALAVAKQGRCSQTVLAFDPLQTIDDIDDAALTKIKRTNHSQEIPLGTCYRQRAEVGERTKGIVAAISDSTPFLASQKKKDWWARHRYLTSISNEWRLTNPGGHVETHDASTDEDVEHEVARILAEPLWSHWSPVVVFYEDDRLSAVPAERFAALLRESSVDYRVVKLSEVESVKGTEFQHAALFLSGDTFDEIELGFEGSGQTVYRNRRRLRIPFSRPKDSMVTFVLRS